MMEGEENSGLGLDVPMDRWEKSLIRLNILFVKIVWYKTEASRFIIASNIFSLLALHRDTDTMISPYCFRVLSFKIHQIACCLVYRSGQINLIWGQVCHVNEVLNGGFALPATTSLKYNGDG